MPTNFKACDSYTSRITARLLEQRNATKRRSLRGARVLFVFLLLCFGGAIASRAQVFSTLAVFEGTKTPLGGLPLDVLVEGVDGNLYGTTSIGGKCASSCGTIFKITPNGTLTTIYEFCGTDPCTREPLTGLALASDGNFYGTTYEGGLEGEGGCQGNVGCGTLFRVTPGGMLTVLHNFTFAEAFNTSTVSLLQGANGNLYGLSSTGGANNKGTVYQSTLKGAVTVLHTFCSEAYCADGNTPSALLQSGGGNLYGTTAAGACGSSGCNGTVFSLTTSGKLTTLYDFCALSGCSDGREPEGLTQGYDGNFYGVTVAGGLGDSKCASFCGTIFKITPTGTLTTIYHFCSQSGCPENGANPVGNLVQATDGNFYGVTSTGISPGSYCTYHCGTVFKVTPQGKLTTLHVFCSEAKCADGFGPHGLVQGTDGNLYGMTNWGGACGQSLPCLGTVFKVSVGLRPFVKMVPTRGTTATQVIIFGTNLTGATSVTFNGTAAAFKIVSRTEIKATVPTGATTGRIRVETPSGTLVSNVVFRVIP
ncbi:MAG TPA: choice-of-anchor tandem repeat GloVer-containing protein [Candidatus Sulfotelmatobacter sp.]|nr:choice-of-anchor tandem repeat GloVer-containing protein [Candidatus Sulfotelmatobacter sp.]